MKPNILLIILDATRYDRCSYSGYRKNTTPTLDRLGSIYFHNAYSPSTWTLPSHASLFSGLYPTQHRVHAGKDGNFKFTGLPSFVERLERAGYLTLGFSANPNICAYLGFDKGFTEFHEFQRKTRLPIPRQSDDPSGFSLKAVMIRTLRKALRWFFHRTVVRFFPYQSTTSMTINASLKRRLVEVSEPFFLFINYMDVHDYMLVQKIRDPSLAYDTMLAYNDACVADLLQFLDAEGLLRNTVVIVTSDHGEMLGEHGVSSHLDSYPYDPVIHIPLVIRGLEADAVRVDVTRVFNIAALGEVIVKLASGRSCLDCVKDIPRWIGVESIGNLEKIDLVERGSGDDQVVIANPAMVTSYDQYRVLIDDAYKLVHDVNEDEITVFRRADDSRALHGAERDPRLLAILRRWERELKPLTPRRVYTPSEEAEITKRLRSLGYI